MSEPTQEKKGPGTITIINNESRLTPFYTKQYKASEVDPKKGIKNGNGVYYLTPGLNEVPRDIWAQMEKHPTFASLIADGKIEPFEPVSTAAPTDPQKGPEKLEVGSIVDLNVMSDKDALKLIENTMEGEKLTKWKKTVDQEKRRRLYNAIDEQLKKLFAGDEDSK
jgi:hypothetical protein